MNDRAAPSYQLLDLSLAGLPLDRLFLISDLLSFEGGVLVLSFLDNCIPLINRPGSTSLFDHLIRAISISAVSGITQQWWLLTPSTNYALDSSRFFASRADLLPNYLSQRLIDPVLPARSGFLKVIKNVPVNSQGDKLLGIRDRRTLRREFCGLRSCRLERRFSRIP